MTECGSSLVIAYLLTATVVVLTGGFLVALREVTRLRTQLTQAQETPNQAAVETE